MASKVALLFGSLAITLSAASTPAPFDTTSLAGKWVPVRADCWDNLGSASDAEEFWNMDGSGTWRTGGASGTFQVYEISTENGLDTYHIQVSGDYNAQLLRHEQHDGSWYWTQDGRVLEYWAKEGATPKGGRSGFSCRGESVPTGAPQSESTPAPQSCRAWGYSSERCGEMECLSCTDEPCDWGNYFERLDANPHDFGYQDLGSSASWTDTPRDLDAVRMTPGCSVELRTSRGTYTFSSDVRVCGNDVGCDSIISIRVFGNPDCKYEEREDMCTSLGNDCCAPRDEAKTCQSGWKPKIKGECDGDPRGTYTCVPECAHRPPCAQVSQSQIQRMRKVGYELRTCESSRRLRRLKGMNPGPPCPKEKDQNKGIPFRSLSKEAPTKNPFKSFRKNLPKMPVVKKPFFI